MTKKQMEQMYHSLMRATFDGSVKCSSNYLHDSFMGTCLMWDIGEYCVEATFIFEGEDKWELFLQTFLHNDVRFNIHDSIKVDTLDINKVMTEITKLIIKAKQMPNVMDVLKKTWATL